MEPICPACRQKDRSCKVRFLNDKTFFSCKSCFEVEEKRLPDKPRDLDPLRHLGYEAKEPRVLDR